MSKSIDQILSELSTALEKKNFPPKRRTEFTGLVRTALEDTLCLYDSDSILEHLGGTTDAAFAAELGVPVGVVYPLKAVLGLSSVVTKPSAKEGGENEKDDKRAELGAGGAVSDKKVGQMPWISLLQIYNCKEVNNVSKRLEGLSRGKRCIVFDDTAAGTVNAALSFKLLNEISEGEPERQTLTHDGKIYAVYRVGERPVKNLADVNPLFPGHFLRSDGTCTLTEQNWSGVTGEVRILTLLIVKENGRLYNENDRPGVRRWIEEAKQANAFANIAGLYPAIAVKYETLKHSDQLPSLKGVREEKKEEVVEEKKKDEVDGYDKPAANPGGVANIGRKQLAEALMSAFDKGELDRMLDFKMDIRLGHVVNADGAMVNVVSDLIRYLESRGRIGQLIAAAHAFNPTNGSLLAVWQQAGGANIGRVNLVTG